jgi:zinc transporter, ZIP family
VRNVSLRIRSFLNASATGILLFLLWDVPSKGIEPLTSALTDATQHDGSWLRFVQVGSVFVVCLTIGLMSLVYYDRWLARRSARPRFGPGAAEAAELHLGPIARLSPAQRLALFIALGIGFHNLSEGLAIGQAAAGGELLLALLLVIGFGLHNATEGFGIVGPLTADASCRPGAFLAYSA